MSSAVPRSPIRPSPSRPTARTIRDADGRAYLDAAGGAIVVNVGHGRADDRRRDGRPGRPARLRARQRLHDRAARGVRGARSGPTCRVDDPAHLPRQRLARRRSRPRSSWPAPTTSPAARRTAGSSSPAGAAITATPSARSTCPGASRCAARTRAGWAASATSPPPTRTAPTMPGAQCPRQRRRARGRLERPFGAAGPGTVAAFVAEPIVGATLAAVVPPDGYWPAIAEVCRRHGVLLIADEVMTGFGRTGRWFGVDHWGVRPGHPRRGQGRHRRAIGRSGSWPPRGEVYATVDRCGGLRPRVHLLALAGRGGRGTRGPAHPGGRRARGGERRQGRAPPGARSTRDWAGIRRSARSAAAASSSGIELVADRETREPFPRAARVTEAVVREAREHGVLALFRHGLRQRHRRRHDPAGAAVHGERARTRAYRHRRGGCHRDGRVARRLTSHQSVAARLSYSVRRFH